MEPILDRRTGLYADALVQRVTRELGAGLVGVYLFGSAALSDYRPPRSDLDVAVVAARSLTPEEKERLAGRLDHRNLACPARKLELVVYERARLVSGDVSFELDLNTGEGVHEWRTDPARSPTHWFVLDVAIGREHGIPMSGPPAIELFPRLEEKRILEALAESLDWYADHAGQGGDTGADPADTVLNACRAWKYLEEGDWSSKGEAGRWAVARDPAVGQALARREGHGAGPAIAEARRVSGEVRRLIRACSGDV